jgi:hypothetical protein
MSKNVVVFIEKVENGGKYLLLDFPVKKNNEDYFQNFLEMLHLNQTKFLEKDYIMKYLNNYYKVIFGGKIQLFQKQTMKTMII